MSIYLDRPRSIDNDLKSVVTNSVHNHSCQPAFCFDVETAVAGDCEYEVSIFLHCELLFFFDVESDCHPDIQRIAS